MPYAWEKFHNAMHTLTGADSIQDRLADAYRLHLIHLDANKLPKEIQQDFEKLGENLTKVKANGDEGTVAATTATMSNDEARKHIETILSMYDVVVRYEERLMRS